MYDFLAVVVIGTIAGLGLWWFLKPLEEESSNDQMVMIFDHTRVHSQVRFEGDKVYLRYHIGDWERGWTQDVTGEIVKIHDSYSVSLLVSERNPRDRWGVRNKLYLTRPAALSIDPVPASQRTA